MFLKPLFYFNAPYLGNSDNCILSNIKLISVLFCENFTCKKIGASHILKLHKIKLKKAHYFPIQL